MEINAQVTEVREVEMSAGKVDEVEKERVETDAEMDEYGWSDPEEAWLVPTTIDEKFPIDRAVATKGFCE